MSEVLAETIINSIEGDARLTTAEAAEAMGVSPLTLVRTWKRGKVKGPTFHKINHNHGYYLRSEVDQFLEEHGPVHSARLRRSETTEADGFDWSWATPEAMAGLRRESISWANRYALDADEIVSEASLYISCRPGHLDDRSPRYLYDAAVSHAVRNLRTERNKRSEVETLASDEFWEMC